MEELADVHIYISFVSNMVFSWLLQPIFMFFFPKKQPMIPTLAELDDGDVAYDREVTVFDSEGLLVENGEVVGATALIQATELIPTDGKLPSG